MLEKSLCWTLTTTFALAGFMFSYRDPTQTINSTALILVTLDSPSKCQLYASTSTRWQTQWLFVSCYPSSVLKVRSINRGTLLYQRKLLSPNDRVDFHPTEPWLITGLYNGSVNIYNHQNGAIVRTFEVSQVPVRCVRFIPARTRSLLAQTTSSLEFSITTHTTRS